MNRQRPIRIAEHTHSKSWIDLLMAIWAVICVVGFIVYIFALQNGMPVAFELCVLGRYVYVAVVASCLIGLVLRCADVLKGQSRQ